MEHIRAQEMAFQYFQDTECSHLAKKDPLPNFWGGLGGMYDVFCKIIWQVFKENFICSGPSKALSAKFMLALSSSAPNFHNGFADGLPTSKQLEQNGNEYKWSRDPKGGNILGYREKI